MKNLNHTLDGLAIIKAYPNVAVITLEGEIFDHDGKEVTIDQTLVDAARVELNKLNYQKSRTGSDGSTDTIYFSIQEQLDMQYWDAVNGTTTWKDHVTAVKAKYPKPS
tara:strand:- start:14 stop:337 length:324 start_codon:yes stop_codon:yes gene_type:complete